jgi:hypothetical protein
VIFGRTQTRIDSVGSAENRAQVIGPAHSSTHILPLGIVQRPAKEHPRGALRHDQAAIY